MSGLTGWPESDDPERENLLLPTDVSSADGAVLGTAASRQSSSLGRLQGSQKLMMLPGLRTAGAELLTRLKP